MKLLARNIAALSVLLAIVLQIDAAAQARDALTGEWLVRREIYDTTTFHRITFTLQGSVVTGTFASGRTLEGTLQGNVLRFTSKQGTETIVCTATVNGGQMTGTFVVTISGDPNSRREDPITGAPTPVAHAGPRQRHDFKPTVFYHQFSASTPPALHISPGDTVHTITLDNSGRDEHGVMRGPCCNPQTGPFFVDGVWPTDTLVVRFTRIRLNRDYATSGGDIVDRAADPDMVRKIGDQQPVRWRLDRERMVATSERPGDHLKEFRVPLRPMLGCVATAPSTYTPIPTSDSGSFGGNMDVNEIVEGTTVYLRVNTPGALLYIGDGHAAQGDGELNGDALETSMEVEFTVDVIRDKRIAGPRVESDTHIITVGLGGSLEDALRAATSGMAQWLEQDYALTGSELAQVLGSSVQFSISEVADRNAGVIAKLSKERLATLTKKR